MANRIFAVGDLHGCSRTFRKLVHEVLALDREDVLYCLGDYIDRGPDSKGVVDFILELRAAGYRIETLRGNHEELMFASVNSKERHIDWVANGGYQTLRSFDISSYDEMPKVYRQFFHQTKHFAIEGNYILVHAGLNFKVDDPLSDLESMLWIRNFNVDYEKLGDRIIVHGHTPLPLEEILHHQKPQVYDIDGGCVYTQRAGFGYLVALELGTNRIIAVPNEEET